MGEFTKDPGGHKTSDLGTGVGIIRKMGPGT